VHGVATGEDEQLFVICGDYLRADDASVRSHSKSSVEVTFVSLHVVEQIAVYNVYCTFQQNFFVRDTIQHVTNQPFDVSEGFKKIPGIFEQLVQDF